eukprot:363384-Chlamydomonas_euryale.AAC.5
MPMTRLTGKACTLIDPQLRLAVQVRCLPPPRDSAARNSAGSRQIGPSVQLRCDPMSVTAFFIAAPPLHRTPSLAHGRTLCVNPQRVALSAFEACTATLTPLQMTAAPHMCASPLPGPHPHNPPRPRCRDHYHGDSVRQLNPIGLPTDFTKHHAYRPEPCHAPLGRPGRAARSRAAPAPFVRRRPRRRQDQRVHPQGGGEGATARHHATDAVAAGAGGLRHRSSKGQRLLIGVPR